MNIVERRATCLKAMNDFIIELGDEDIYMDWILVVPDESTPDDFNDIGENIELYNEVCRLFAKLVIYDKENNY